MRRWMLALQYGSQPDHEEVYPEELDPEQSDLEQPNALDPEFFVDRISNWPRFRGFLQDWVLYLGFGVTGVVYGGLHCAAWSAPFPTHLEAVLWRVSSVAVSATGFLVFLLYCWELSNPWKDWATPIEWVGVILGLNRLTDWMIDDTTLGDIFSKTVWRTELLAQNWLKMGQMVLKGILVIPILVIFVIMILIRVAFDMFVLTCVVLYFLARAFLVVECFINLTHLPDSAYQIPQWTQYLPFIS